MYLHVVYICKYKLRMHNIMEAVHSLVEQSYSRLPRLPPFLLVLSEGMGVTSSVCVREREREREGERERGEREREREGESERERERASERERTWECVIDSCCVGSYSSTTMC